MVDEHENTDLATQEEEGAWEGDDLAGRPSPVYTKEVDDDDVIMPLQLRLLQSLSEAVE